MPRSDGDVLAAPEGPAGAPTRRRFGAGTGGGQGRNGSATKASSRVASTDLSPWSDKPRAVSTAAILGRALYITRMCCVCESRLAHLLAGKRKGRQQREQEQEQDPQMTDQCEHSRPWHGVQQTTQTTAAVSDLSYAHTARRSKGNVAGDSHNDIQPPGQCESGPYPSDRFQPSPATRPSHTPSTETTRAPPRFSTRPSQLAQGTT